MVRWQPNARERLEKAAMELFQQRGYDRTTVEDIAARAGLTERTFFRHFADKREVLFAGSDHFLKSIADGVLGAPRSASPIDAVRLALEAVSDGLEEARGRTHVKMRQALLEAHDELRERELIKLAALVSAIAGALRARGVPDPVASLTAETGIVVFKVAFERWVGDQAEGQRLSEVVRAVLEELRTITVAAPAREATKARRPAAG